jgi:hypothetical protein
MNKTVYLILCTLQKFDHTTGSKVWHRKHSTQLQNVWKYDGKNGIIGSCQSSVLKIQQSQAVNKCNLRFQRIVQPSSLSGSNSSNLLSVNFFILKKALWFWKHQWTIHPETEHNFPTGLEFNDKKKKQGSWSLAKQRTCGGHTNKMDVKWTDLAQDHVQRNASIPSVFRSLQFKTIILSVVFYRYAT